MQPRIFTGMRRHVVKPGVKMLALVVTLAAIVATLGTPPVETALSPENSQAARNSDRPRPLRGWAGGFSLTQYYPTPEYWFGGPAREFPGISGRHRVAWLLSAHGIAMEGDGWSMRETGPGTRWVNYVNGEVGWLNERARKTAPGGPHGWTNGPPVWLQCGWVNRRGRWTFPSNYLEKGEPVKWARGRPARWVGCNVEFHAGEGRKLRFWNSVAVDQRLFPAGRTWFYIPAYRSTRCGGWFRADDLGGAVSGRHIDIYRPPPRVPHFSRSHENQRVLIVRGRKPPANPCR